MLAKGIGLQKGRFPCGLFLASEGAIDLDEKRPLLRAG